MKQRKYPTYEEVSQVLEYAPELGGSCLRWKQDMSDRVKKGHLVGCVTEDTKYWVFGLWGWRYYAHMVVWLLNYKTWPNKRLDHKDKDKTNNVIDNLRESTAAQNGQGRLLGSNNRSGMVGVSWVESRQKWRVALQVNKKLVFIGYYSDLEKAKQACIAAKREHHTFHPDF